jgi:DNA-directed RNA polymerase beta' subunit
MLKHNVKDVEHVIDPETGRKIPEVLTGVRYFLKLHHTAESKGQGRSTGGYTAAGEPAKGGETGSKRLALLDTQALLSHGAVHTLQDAHLIRGQRNDDFWLAFMQGHNPPKPKVPLVFQKFVNELKASGINVVPEAGKLNIMALTDKDIATLAGSRKLKNSDTLQVEKDMRPIPGGLFDPQLFGAEGERWASFDLPEPMPNPVMEEPIRRVLGLTQKELEAVVTGTKELPTGTGPGAIHKALTSIDVAKEIAAARMAIASGKRTARDTAIRKLGYLKSCEKLGIHPSEWMVTSVPVLPPKFRPISLMSGSNVPLVPDPNYLYRELFEATQNLRELSGAVDDISNERAAVYKGFKAVAGLADPTHPKLVEKNVKGILRTIFGSSPKSGTVQAKLISTSTDAVGRATVAPDPDLDMDHLGLPENRAWDIYKTFIVRRLRRRGLPVTEAARHVEDRTPLARNELIAEMDARPVIMNRAPVLHRYGILAFKPRLVKGDILRVSPLIVGGFGMDFDGDASQYHVPVSQSSVQEALERMLPSKNLLAASDMKTPMHGMRQEYQGGLYAATALPKPDKRPHRFIDKQSAMAAFRRGDLPLDAVVEIQQ